MCYIHVITSHKNVNISNNKFVLIKIIKSSKISAKLAKKKTTCKESVCINIWGLLRPRLKTSILAYPSICH